MPPTDHELADDLEALICDQEEPFGSTSIYAQWRVNAAAHEAGMVVLLDGQGADELFGGYPWIVGTRRSPAAHASGGALRAGGAARAYTLRALAGHLPAPLAPFRERRLPVPTLPRDGGGRLHAARLSPPARRCGASCCWRRS